MVADAGELIAGRYRLVSRLGSGAMGVVWRAQDERLGRTVAIKQLRAPIGMSSTRIEQSHQRAQREARIAARLQHPHAVAVYDVVEHEGRPCLVMEYVASRSLAEVLADGRVLTTAEVGTIGAQLASALIAAHEAGIVHRDVKPGNILIEDSGSVKLTDFGISRASGDVTVTTTGEMLGTPAYISPEVAQGRPADAASDVFSLGATLYAALEGVPPFGTGTNAMALLLRIVHGEIRQPEHTGALVDTVMWMLAQDPANRPSMEQVQRELESATDETVPFLPSSDPEGRADGPAAALAETASDESAEAAEAPSPSPAAVPSAAPAPKKTPRSRPAILSRAHALPIALLVVAALLTAGIVAAITAHSNSSGSAGSPPAATHGTQTAGSTHSKSAAPTTGTAATTKAATKPATTSAATTSPTTTGSATPSATTSASVAQQLSSAISHYYTLVPGDLSEAWGYLTPGYQQNTAKGEANYDQFWNQMQSVSLSDLQAEPPSTVVATLDYVYKSGKTVQERTQFGLVLQGGGWKIAQSTVLSSTML